jgi:hypothetical protein
LVIAILAPDGDVPAVAANARLAGFAASRGRPVTVTLTVFDAAPDVAVMVALPADIPVTTPAPSTAAMVEALDVNVTARAVSACPFAALGVAVIVARSPTTREIVGGLTSIVATSTGVLLVESPQDATMNATRKASAERSGR